jgi:UDP-N-acetylglucosamine diphosphorylase/glucosamine-1-phosphate N-acetyltransferase
MNIYLDDSKCREHLFPFTHTRHTADIRIGILTIKQKWKLLTAANIFTNEKNIPEDALLINANIIPTLANINIVLKAAADKVSLIENDDVHILQYPWQIFQLNDKILRQDFTLITSKRQSQKISETNNCIAKQNIFIEAGAKVEYCFLNAANGPIYIGKDAEIMEGSMIRGTFALGEKSVLKMGSKIYGATSIGPYCLAGGEIKNSVMFGYSNKAHDGYLGDSVLGEWCNLGAGTSNSNVKNTGGDVKYIINQNRDAIYAGNKAGLLMGDYSRSAINTAFNTGAIVGVCCNLFENKITEKYIENFTWGNERYILEKAIKDISNWKKMKQQDITQAEIEILKKLYLLNQ